MKRAIWTLLVLLFFCNLLAGQEQGSRGKLKVRTVFGWYYTMDCDKANDKVLVRERLGATETVSSQQVCAVVDRLIAEERKSK